MYFFWNTRRTQEIGVWSQNHDVNQYVVIPGSVTLVGQICFILKNFFDPSLFHVYWNILSNALLSWIPCFFLTVDSMFFTMNIMSSIDQKFVFWVILTSFKLCNGPSFVGHNQISSNHSVLELFAYSIRFVQGLTTRCAFGVRFYSIWCVPIHVDEWSHTHCILSN